MPKYLIQGSYNQTGLQGLTKEGASSRQRYIEQLVQSLGGKVEAFYWAYGADDVVLIMDLPTAEDAIALSLTVNATGAVSIRTTPLITAQQMDAAIAKRVNYRPPGT